MKIELWHLRWLERQMPAAAHNVLNRVKLVTTVEEADVLIAELAAIHEKAFSFDADLAIREARIDIGYFAGYFDHDDRARIEQLFRTEHPAFGSITENGPPSPAKALQLGLEVGALFRQRRKD